MGGANPGDIGGRESSSGATPGDERGLDIGGSDSPSGANPGDGGALDIGGSESPSGANPGEGGGLDTGGSDSPGGANPGGANPGEGGGLNVEGGFDSLNGAGSGDGGDLENEKEAGNSGSVCFGATRESRLKRPNFPGSDSSSFSDHVKLDGADDGPGEIGSPRLGVEFPRV